MLTEKQKREHMRLIKLLAQIYDECWGPESFQRGVPFRNHLNATERQTVCGLCLEFEHDVPTRLWAPWGRWPFSSVLSYAIDVDAFMSRLVVDIHQDRHTNAQTGCDVGPIYAIKAVDGHELPSPSLKRQEEFIDRKAAHAEWDKLFNHRYWWQKLLRM